MAYWLLQANPSSTGSTMHFAMPGPSVTWADAAQRPSRWPGKRSLKSCGRGLQSA
jgi:hypothetical protein